MLWQSIKRGCEELMRRKVLYVWCVVVVPLAMSVFFVSLLDKGVAEQVPSAVVDLNRSEMSRTIVRNLGTMPQVDLLYSLDSYSEAMTLVRQGKIMGFFLVPHNFGDDVLSGRQPTLSYYINFGYIVPGSLLEKGYTTISMLANGEVVQDILSESGVSQDAINAILQPIALDVHPLGNPTMNYGVYLTNSFAPGVLALMVLLVTVYSITSEIKYGRSRKWLASASNSIVMALVGKLLPFTLLFTIVGWAMLLIFYAIVGYPMNGEMWTMMLAVILLVSACQALAVIVCAILPNPRYALSVCSLLGVLAFSVCGYSFPVENMYSGVGIFSYILPMRYYFLIYINQALNGLDWIYSFDYFAALLTFPLAALVFLPLLKRALLKPIKYIE